MTALEHWASDGAFRREVEEFEDAITAEERAEWLIDYILLHQREDRTQLLRVIVQQINAAEAQGYDFGWRHGREELG